jgi:hypothetical protein
MFESPQMTCISEAHLFDNPYFVLPGKVPACSKCGRAAKEECVPRPDVRAHLEGVAALMNGSDQTSKWMKELRTKKEVVGSVDPLWQRSPGVGIWGLR